MGSGGGGGSTGITFKKPRPCKQPGRPKGGGGGGSGGGGDSGPGGGDACYLTFETDLAAVDPGVASTLVTGASLSVSIVTQGNYQTVVCLTNDGQRVGALANVEDLAQLIACMRAGHHYTAEVRRVGRTYCTVFVEHF